MLGVPATGSVVEWSEIHIYRIVDCRIMEHWVEWSQFELMAQLQPKK